jgi:hypothetical protein
MTDPAPVPAEHAADAWQKHRPALEALSAELAARDPVLARSLEGAMQIRDAILVELLGRHVAAQGGEDAGAGTMRQLGERIAAEARGIAGHGGLASQAGGH